MLGDKQAMATIPVKNVNSAKIFYEGKLGLKQFPAKETGALLYKSGDSVILVYESQYAGTNRATAATWVVGNEVDMLVADLRAKGLSFEHYDLPGMTLKGDVHEADGMKAAWLKDPDGNILALVSR